MRYLVTYTDDTLEWFLAAQVLMPQNNLLGDTKKEFILFHKYADRQTKEGWHLVAALNPDSVKRIRKG